MAWDEDQKKCGGITFAGLFTLIIGVAMIAMGAHFYDPEDVSEAKEPCSKCLPMMLIIGGAIFILALVGRFILQRCCRKLGEIGNDDKVCSSLNFVCKFGVVFIYDILISILFFVWLVMLTYRTMQIHGNVVFPDGQSSTEVVPATAEGDTTYECAVVLYDTSFWLTIALWVIFALSVVCGLLAKFCECFYNILCCKPCQRAEANSQAV